MNAASPDPKSLLSNEWTAVAIGLIAAALHLWWFASEHQGDVLAGFGGFLAALGIFIASQPYIRKGVVETAREQVGLQDAGESNQRAEVKEEETEREGVRHVLKERVIGVLLIALGSMLNGYGVAIAHLFSLKGP